MISMGKSSGCCRFLKECFQRKAHLKTSTEKRTDYLRWGAVLSYASLAINILLSILYTPLMLCILRKSGHGLFNTITSGISCQGFAPMNDTSNPRSLQYFKMSVRRCRSFAVMHCQYRADDAEHRHGKPANPKQTSGSDAALCDHDAPKRRVDFCLFVADMRKSARLSPALSLILSL